MRGRPAGFESTATKQNRTRAARRAREAQQTGTTSPYTELLRAAALAGDGTPSLETVAVAPGASVPCRTTEERHECAQVVANALTELTDPTGARYPAAAHVLVPATQSVPGFVALMANVHALRNWSEPDSVADTVNDMKRALLTALVEHWPEDEHHAVGIEAIRHSSAQPRTPWQKLRCTASRHSSRSARGHREVRDTGSGVVRGRPTPQGSTRSCRKTSPGPAPTASCRTPTW